jgi:DNA polymerase epsilon subunit 1
LLQPNHLLGYQRLFFKLKFRNVPDLLTVRKDLLPLALANSSKMDAMDAYAEAIQSSARMDIDLDGLDPLEVEADSTSRKERPSDPRQLITDIREYDVTYYLRMAIDNGDIH